MLGLRFSRLVHAAIASGALVLAACPDGGKGDTDTDTATATGTATDGPTTDDPTGPPIDPTPLPPDPTNPLPPPDPPPPADVPPALLGVKLRDPSTLQLSFTEPLAPVDTVNPKRFRLSMAQAYMGNYGGQPSTTLIDLRYYNLEQVCPPDPPAPCYYEPPYNYYYCYYEPFCYYQSTGELVATDVAPLDGDPTSLLISLSAPIQPFLCSTLDAFEDNPNFQMVLHLHYAAGGLSALQDLTGLAVPSLGDAWVKYDGNFYSYQGGAFSTLNPFLPIPCDLFDVPDVPDVPPDIPESDL
ncbi:hypothetical protein [Nannocystis punicea]|uniref:Lipoprotein n=1 Tax=Nannocystis punicea TaxID=2995304 RepID=A0ABY7HCD5_9BACT|nr:hypothetical protein [Nannocystis poenicansa]WAS96956.1 hypothetical protein O0S08_12475 [Nannocystis poenicansa]